jgi:PAS domain S-box-containing protein
VEASSERMMTVPLEQTVGGVALFPAWLHRLGYYGLALLFVAVATLLRWAFSDVLSLTPFLVFYLALVGAAAFGGLGPGLLATLASWLCIDFLFDPTPGHIGFDNSMSVVRLLVFLAGGLVVSIVGEKMRHTRMHERRQAGRLAELARSLESEKDTLQAVMNGARNSHLVYLDRAFHFVRVNEAYARSCGYTPEEMIGKNHFALYPSAENEAIFARVRDTGAPVEFHDKPFVFPDQPERGTTYWDWTLTPIKNDAGYVEGLVFSLFETTQRKQAEEALRESGRRLSLAQQIAHVGTFDWDIRTGVNVWTPELEGLYGLPPGGFAKTQGAWEQLVHPDDRVGALRLVDQAFETSVPTEGEWRVVWPDGSVHWLSGRWQVFKDESGTPLRMTGVNIDITERKRAEEALCELNTTLESKVAERTAELEQRARQLQKLTLELSETEERERKRLAQLLHDDLQQVLAAAKFHLSRVGVRTGNPGPAQEIVEQVQEMLKDAIAKSRDLSHELSPAVLSHDDVAETLGWLAEQMRAKHGLTVRVEVLGEVKAQSDAVKTLLYRAAQELLFNVVKHARVNEARIRIRCVGRYLCLSVSDRGRGFDPREIKETAGFGLLSIRERVALLGGRMKVKSARGRGTTFRIIVPAGEPSGTGPARQWQTTHE